jgi:hypothetical protein
MAHRLELAYKLSANELLDAIGQRFRLRAALEGAVAEVHAERHVQSLVGAVIEKYEAHDLDGHPDFSLWLPGRRTPIRMECKNMRSTKAGVSVVRGRKRGGPILGYIVETQKTRASQGDASSRFYGADQFDVLAVCLGKLTGDWSKMIFVRTKNLARHLLYPKKLAVLQKVPLPDSSPWGPWYDDLGKLLSTYR